MAQGNKKRYWAAALLAASIAENAHAPLRGSKAAAALDSSSAASVASAGSKVEPADHKLPPSPRIPPIADVQLPQDVRNPPLELATIQPFPLLSVPPLLTSTLPPELESGTQTISLLNPGQGSLPAETQPLVSAPPPSSADPATPSDPVAAPIVGLPTNPPVYGNPVVGTPNVLVPEPGCISFFIGGILLLGRRRAGVRK